MISVLLETQGGRAFTQYDVSLSEKTLYEQSVRVVYC